MRYRWSAEQDLSNLPLPAFSGLIAHSRLGSQPATGGLCGPTALPFYLEALDGATAILQIQPPKWPILAALALKPLDVSGRRPKLDGALGLG